MDWDNFKFIDLFAGIGGIRIPFEDKGGECVFSSEWDKAAQDTYEANFGERPFGDITKINETDIPDHNILLAGFPCQPFSIIGKKKGFSDVRGTLFFDIVRILNEKKPDAFLLENVKMLVSHDKGKTFSVIQECLKDLGYTIYARVLNALDYGVPQKRERIFIVGFKDKIHFEWPKPLEKKALLEDVLELEEDIDPKLYVSKEIQQNRLEKCCKPPVYPSIWHQNKSGNVSPLPYSCALRAGASYNYLLVNGKRRPSGREFLRLQGFSDEFKIVVPYTQIRKQAGNSVSVPTINAVAEQMLKALKNKKIVQFKKTETQKELFDNEINNKSVYG